MALSNWDTLAIGNDGKSCKGSIEVGKIWIEIYKNWISLEGIGSIQSGEVYIKETKIYAIRGRQQSILFVAYYYDRSVETTKGHYYAGIGCYGFGDSFEEYCRIHNIPYSSYDHTSYRGDKIYVVRTTLEGIEEEIEIKDGFELNPWVGVERETVKELQNYICDVLEIKEDYCSGDAKAWFNSIEWDNLTRYNQGDKYFQDNMGLENIESKIGEQQDPFLIQSLKPNKEK